MRHLLAVVGSGMAGGNTNRLTDAFLQGAAEAGHSVQKVFLGEGPLGGCMGCGGCRSGRGCVIDDVMTKVYPLFEACDTLVLASPLYFWTISSQTKAFMDRLYALSKNDLYPAKDTLLLMTAGDDSPNTFDVPLDYYRFITTALGWKDIGSYLAGGCGGGPSKHRIHQKHLDAAYEFGKALT